jgi:hypothetical protein
LTPPLSPLTHANEQCALIHHDVTRKLLAGCRNP